MTSYSMYAIVSSGLESVVRHELEMLGYKSIQSENGRISFSGCTDDILSSNLKLRAANRIFIEAARFTARDFDTYFDGIVSIPWTDLIDSDGRIVVTGSTRKSKLHHLPTCQAMAKKAIVNQMRASGVKTLPETGSTFHVHVSIVRDFVTVGLDTTGSGLHRRGYRKDTGTAPIRETLAAALVELSRWSDERPLVDPFCGSGTILIEAAMKSRKFASGLLRRFDCEEWSWMDRDRCRRIRNEISQAVVRTSPCDIRGFDQDKTVLKGAKANAQRAKMGESITFQQSSAQKTHLSGGYGCVITNPPYGERSGDIELAEQALEILGKMITSNPTWSFFILSSRQDLRPYIRQKPTKMRKLYNGKIRCYLHQFFGPFPPGKRNSR